MIQRQLTVRCDGGDLPEGGTWPKDFVRCTAAFVDDGVQAAPAIRKAAKKAGWNVKDGWEYCPRHRDLAP